MNILFLVLGFASVIIWLLMGITYFNTMRKKPIFNSTRYKNNDVIYPSLSIVVPACNEEESIGQAISSLLVQDYPNLEVIVVNDRSTDNTGVILEKLKIKYPELKVVNITNLSPKMVKTVTRGGINWRGTIYPLEELRKHTM